MPKQETNLNNFKINILTETQYQEALNANQINENELYMTPEEVLSLTWEAIQNKPTSFTPSIHTHNANQVTFADGLTFQQKCDSGQLTGPQGPQGETGPQGPRGLQGDVGPQGPQGLKGDKGDRGEQGLQGPRGYDGLDGQDGRDGLTTSITFNGQTYTQYNGNIVLPNTSTTKIKQNVTVSPSYTGGTYPYKADVYIYGVSANDIADASLAEGVVCDEFEGTNTKTNYVELLFSAQPVGNVNFSYISVTKGEVI